MKPSLLATIDNGMTSQEDSGIGAWTLRAPSFDSCWTVDLRHNAPKPTLQATVVPSSLYFTFLRLADLFMIWRTNQSPLLIFLNNSPRRSRTSTRSTTILPVSRSSFRLFVLLFLFLVLFVSSYFHLLSSTTPFSMYHSIKVANPLIKQTFFQILFSFVFVDTCCGSSNDMQECMCERRERTVDKG